MTTARLILWDVDHTLIETGGIGSEVFRDAFEQVTGRKIEKLADVTGRTEPIIFRETLEMYGIDDPGGYFPRFAQAQAAGYRTRADEMRRRGRDLPGARKALESLSHVPGIFQTVLTGNPRPSAEVKLGVFELTHFLDLATGAYGDDDAVRANLVPVARQRARERTGVTFTEKTTVIIGDEEPTVICPASRLGSFSRDGRMAASRLAPLALRVPSASDGGPAHRVRVLFKRLRRGLPAPGWGHTGHRLVSG